MRSADSYWAETEKVALALAASERENHRLRAQVALLEERVRALSAPVPDAFRRAFAAPTQEE